MPNISRLIAVGVFVVACWLLWPARAEQPADQPAATMAEPEYTAEGHLVRPTGFEDWKFVGASVGLGYGPAAVDAKGGPGQFHNVYMQSEAFDHFVREGEFPEKTVFVMTNNPATQKEGDDSINRSGYFEGDPTGLEVAVKDSGRNDLAWAYYIFKGGQDGQKTAKAFDRESCYDCHAEHGDADNVFVQFYSVLRAERARHVAAQEPAKAKAESSK